jgi:hypothetical protein
MHSNAMMFPKPNRWCINMYHLADIDAELRSFIDVDIPEAALSRYASDTGKNIVRNLT